MAEARFTVRVVLSPLTPEALVDRIADIVSEHIAQCSEGVVPAVVAEEIVDRLIAHDALIFLEPADE